MVNQSQPLPVEIRQPKVTTKDAIMRVVAYAWGPVGEAGIVLVLLMFILLEHDSLRDRLVLFAGQTERRRTIKALSDATAGISRFFFSQLVVNVTFGTVLGLACGSPAFRTRPCSARWRPCCASCPTWA